MTDKGRPGIIGLGMIGGGVVSSLVKSGLSPTVFDVRAEASAAFGDAVSVASSPADLARNSDVVLLAVVTAEQAKSVLTASDGVFAGAHSRTIIVLLSTVSLGEVRNIAGLCEDAGVAFADAGVTGGARAADNGLVVMLGSTEETAERITPVIEAFARSVVHCGPVGTGMAMKLARNAVTFSSWAAIREAAALASAAGVPVERLLEVLEVGTGDGTDQINALRTVAAGPSATDEQIAGAVRIVRKDLAAIQSLAGDLNIEVPIVNATVPDVEGIFRGQLQPVKEGTERERGLAAATRVYGAGIAESMAENAHVPTVERTLDHVFADVWARPHLSLRDRRLLAMAATTMLGRQDLLEIQLRSALALHDVTSDQLREVALFLSYYAGWQNGSAINMVVERLLEEQSG